MADNLGKLPNEVMMEILSRLPPESLLRFKCVAKSWYALIKDPKFGCSLQNQNVLLKRIVRNKETGKDETRLSFFKYPLAADDIDTSVEDVDFPCFAKEFQVSEIHGHSHGLVCLEVCPLDIFLYNPTTREIRKLPPSILHVPEPPYPYEGLSSMTTGIGFGYDPKSRDFKVVRIVLFAEQPSVFYPCRTEVYDLGKNRWREIESLLLGNIFWKPSFEITGGPKLWKKQEMMK